MLLWHKTIEIHIFSFASFANIRQVPTVLASPGRRVANASGGFALDTTLNERTYIINSPSFHRESIGIISG
jgi:hypothetical protein